MRIAFYAPLKAPTHDVPSGDRRMARLLMSALARAGHDVELASEFRAFDGAGDAARQRAIAEEAGGEAKRVLRRISRLTAAERPAIWCTYHVYHKSPDYLGPMVKERLGLAYLIVEASHAPRRADGPWAIGFAAARRAIRAADAVVCLARYDMDALAPLVRPPATLNYLPPFMDEAEFADTDAAARAAIAQATGLDPTPPWLLCVAMMRHGDKLASYARLAAALGRLSAQEWRLLIVGDGPGRDAVERLMRPFGERVAFLGRRTAAELPAIYGAADIYVWPAVGEAYGMAFLEAAAAGLPAVATRTRGVPDVVEDGVTGLLAAEGDDAGFADNIERLITDGRRRRRLGRAASAFVRERRNLTSAAKELDRIIRCMPMSS